MRKLVCDFLRPPSVVILFALYYPFCVEVIVEELGFVVIPLSIEVIGFVGIPPSIDVIVGCLALCLSL